MADEKQIEYAPYAEEDKIERALVVWANTWPDIPTDVTLINIEPHLAADATGMMLTTIQSAYIMKHYILGGHKAEYQFSLVYRLKTGTSNDKSLKANEALNRFGDWALTQRPNVGEGIRVLKVEPTTCAALLGIYENGDEDHQILMKLTYEVV